MADLLGFFDDTGLPPHGFCLLWEPGLVWLHVISDALIGISYYAIPLALVYFVVKRRDIGFSWIFWMFAAFILACGTTHFMEIWVLWHPDYALQGLVKAVTAAASLVTAVMLWPLVFRLLAFPTPSQFQEVSRRLVSERQQRRSVEASLHRSEQSLRVLLDGITDHAIFMLDPNGRITSWSRSAARIEGYSECEVLGRHLSLFYGPDDRTAGVPERALDAAARTGKYESEGWRVRKDGSRFWASVVIEALRNPSDKLIGYAKIVRDITEHHRAAEALEQARAALAQAQKMETVGQLTGGIAHDFNNLLTAIMGGADLLGRQAAKLDETSRRVLAGIGEAAQRGTALVQQLLAFSRKQALRPQVTDANCLILGMSELLRRALGGRVRVEMALAADVWPVFVDRNQLENAILNLALNARDAMEEGGTLALETQNVTLDEAYAAANADASAGEFVMLAVRDSGAGMTPEVVQRAFEPFFTTKAEGHGTGLGLSQVYGFVRQSGGHVTIASAPGQGTTVRTYLPRHLGAGAADDDAADTQRRAPLPTGAETVLVVEDDGAVRSYAASGLAHLGYRVLEAAGGEDALALLAAHGGVALLFINVVLPGKSGCVVAAEARRRVRALKVLYTAGHERDGASPYGFAEAGGPLLAKPYTVEALARMVRAVLDAAPATEARAAAD